MLHNIKKKKKQITIFIYKNQFLFLIAYNSYRRFNAIQKRDNASAIKDTYKIIKIVFISWLWTIKIYSCNIFYYDFIILEHISQYCKALLCQKIFRI